MIAYSNNGMSFRAVAPDWVLADGEVAFEDYATEEQLNVAFPGRAQIISTQAFMNQILEYVAAAQSMLDNTARERNYDGILSLCTYATSTSKKFSSEGQAGVAWRDAVWARGYSILSQVQGGTLAPPTIPEFLAMLPAFTWPEEEQ